MTKVLRYRLPQKRQLHFNMNRLSTYFTVKRREVNKRGKDKKIKDYFLFLKSGNRKKRAHFTTRCLYKTHYLL